LNIEVLEVFVIKVQSRIM